MCGGSIEIVTCSRVGHVFRSKTPYTLPGGSDYIVWHNTGRTVDVWLDEWKDFYYALHPGARQLNRGSVEQRLQLRKQLNCKVSELSFKSMQILSFIEYDSRFDGIWITYTRNRKYLKITISWVTSDPSGLRTSAWIQCMVIITEE